MLPETISKELLGPFTRNGDEVWTDIIAWPHFGLIEAEELGVSAANVEDMSRNSQTPAIQRLLGAPGNSARAWASTTVGWYRRSRPVGTTASCLNATSDHPAL